MKILELVGSKYITNTLVKQLRNYLFIADVQFLSV